MAGCAFCSTPLCILILTHFFLLETADSQILYYGPGGTRYSEGHPLELASTRADIRANRRVQNIARRRSSHGNSPQAQRLPAALPPPPALPPLPINQLTSFVQQALFGPPSAPQHIAVVEPMKCGVAKRATNICGNLAHTSASRAKRFIPFLSYKCPLHPANSWPWLAFLIGGDCGAVLIEDPAFKVGSRFLLSTAHCWLKRAEVAHSVMLGGHDLRVPGTHVKIATQFLHPNFSYPHAKLYPNGINPWNDIVVIKLVEPVFYSDTIRPICLADIREDLENENVECVAAGWGCLSELKYCSDRRNYPQIPYQVVLTPTRYCKYPERMICAGFKGKDGPSFKDSGGPLVCRRSGSQNPWTLAGLVHGGFKGVDTIAFTKVSSHWNWINEILLQNYY